MQNYRTFLLSLILIPLLFIYAGCGFITKNTKVTIDKKEGTNYTIYNLKTQDSIQPMAQSPSTVTYKLDNRSLYQLQQTKQDHFLSKELIPKPHPNTLFYLSWGGLSVSTLLMTSRILIPGETGCILGLSGLAGSIWSIAELLSMSPHLHPKTYEPSSLYQRPSRDSTERFIHIQEITTTESTELEVNQYRNYKKYFDNSAYATATQSWGKAHLKFKKNIEELLIETGYQDTTKKLFGGAWETVYLKAKVKDVEIHEIKTMLKRPREETINSLIKYTSEIEWQLINYLTKEEIYSETIDANSPFLAISGSEEDRLEEGAEEMIKRSMSIFLEQEKTQPHLQSKTKEHFAKVESWDTLQLTAPQRASSLQEVSGAGVTVQKEKGHGSGFIVSSDGHIITNYHVTGSEEEVKVTFSNGEEYTARLLRTNPRYDLSLLKIDMPQDSDIKPLTLAKELKGIIGSDVYTVGTPLERELSQSVTQGIISGKRNVEGVDYLQYDASINPGNSGGPVVNKSGELLGVVNVKLVGPTVEGIGFAIPASVISKALKVDFQ